jgi:hypothetical protein
MSVLWAYTDYDSPRVANWPHGASHKFSFGMYFETYEPFIFLNSNFFSGRGKPRIMNQRIRRHSCSKMIAVFREGLHRADSCKQRISTRVNPRARVLVIVRLTASSVYVQ